MVGTLLHWEIACADMPSLTANSFFEPTAATTRSKGLLGTSITSLKHSLGDKSSAASLNGLKPGFTVAVMHIGDYIRAAREAAGITQDELGEACGVTGQSVSQWELGNTEPEVARVPAMARKLQCSTDLLLTGKNPPLPVPEELAAVWMGLETPEKRASALIVLKALSGRAA